MTDNDNNALKASPPLPMDPLYFNDTMRRLIRQVCQSNPRASSLQLQLLTVQARLGTPQEQERDLQEASTLAHELRNIVCVASLSAC